MLVQTPKEFGNSFKIITTSLSGLAIVITMIASFAILFHRVEQLEGQMETTITNSSEVYATVIRLEERTKYMTEKIDRLLEKSK